MPCTIIQYCVPCLSHCCLLLLAAGPGSSERLNWMTEAVPTEGAATFWRESEGGRRVGRGREDPAGESRRRGLPQDKETERGTDEG